MNRLRLRPFCPLAGIRATSAGQPRGTPAAPRVLPGGENVRVDLARIGWLAVVLVCAITVLILAVQGYSGYAGVTFAVAVAAAINLR
jgi:hypothetical protein